jgi:hypothetical protein
MKKDLNNKPKHILEVINMMDTKNEFLFIKKRRQKKTYVIMPIEVHGHEPEITFVFLYDNFRYVCSKDKIAGAIIDLNWIYDDEYLIGDKKNVTVTVTVKSRVRKALAR